MKIKIFKKPEELKKNRSEVFLCGPDIYRNSVGKEKHQNIISQIFARLKVFLSV